MKQLHQEVSSNATVNSGHKETRWDRIRKRCSNSGVNSIKTEMVRRFIERDYIGKRNTNIMEGEQSIESVLNPALVMDMRHELFRRIPRKLPLVTVKNQKNLKTCRNHNIAVEERFIDNELKKLRQQLENNRKRHIVKLNNKVIHEDLHLVDNKNLVESLEATSKCLNDFYNAPLDAFTEVEQLCLANTEDQEYEYINGFTTDICEIEKYDFDIEEPVENTKIEVSVSEISNEPIKDNIQNVSENELLSETINFQIECRSRNIKSQTKVTSANSEFERHTPSPLTPTDEFLKPMREAAAKHQAEARRVRFEDEIGLHKYERENSSCSNTSDGLDSIISDLAEEALYELQMEEQGTAPCYEEVYHEQEHTTAIVENLPDTKQNNQIKSPLTIVGESTKGQGNEKDFLLITPIKLPSKVNMSEDQKISSTEDEDESTSVHEQNVIIEQLFQSRAQTNVVIMRKYFLKWVHYTTITKIERETTASKTDRIHQINMFLDKIRKEKVRISKSTKDPPNDTQPPSKGNIQITKKYQNKIKMQQDIIDLQRLKLERQERLIMELKLKKLSDEAKEARQEIKNELKAVIRSGDEKSKAKAKCLQLIGNLRDAEDEDEFKRLQGKSLLMPKFLQKMQERALERSIRHEQARQRRLQQEAEREAQKIAAEEAKRLEDEEAKRMRIEALKEKRRMEKMAKILKEREHQRMVENKRKALEFCRHRLLSRIGMEGFKRLLQRKRDYARKCEALRRKVIKRTFFVAWRELYFFETSRRKQKADDLNCLLVKRKAFHVWGSYVAEERSKYYVAIDWYDMKLSTYMFKEWAAYTGRMKLIEKSKMRKAISHFEWNLKFKVLDCWQRLPQILRLEKETEERRQRWRMKIWELLPDYTPRLDTFV